MNKILLSIIIPTRNRTQYCFKVIQAILEDDFQNFEIIIQDNSSNQELKQLIDRDVKDERLKYFYTEKPLSFIDNFNMAIENSNGEYVLVIGDDDGITKNLFPVVEWAKKNDVDSICPVELVHYVWPNESTDGKMVIPYSTTKMWQNSPLANIQNLVEDGIIQYMNFNLPKLYHGIIRKDRLDALKNKTGYYLGGLTPDIYASVALTSVVKKNVVIDFPITIAGACPKSATIDNTKGKHSGMLENAPHFNNRGNYVWDSRIPEFYSVQTIWAETALKAIEEHGIEADITKLNLEKMLAGALIDSNKYEDFFIEKTLEKSSKTKSELLKSMKKYKNALELKIFIKRAKGRIPRKYFFRNLRITNIEDIQKCTLISNKELTTHYKIQQILSNFSGKKQQI